MTIIGRYTRRCSLPTAHLHAHAIPLLTRFVQQHPHAAGRPVTPEGDSHMHHLAHGWPWPALPRLLWADPCDPRTDPQACHLGDVAILAPFYGVITSLGAQLRYAVPPGLQELATYDVVIANFCSALDSAAVRLLQAYISGGGSVVAMGDNFCVGTPFRTSAQGATALTQPGGIRFTTEDDGTLQCFDPLLAHPLTRGVRQLYSPRHAYLTVSGTAQALFGKEGQTFIAVYAGRGTVVAIPDIGFHWQRRGPRPVNDNVIFWQTMLRWLVTQSRGKRGA